MTPPQTVIHNRLLAKVSYRHLQAVMLTAEFGSTHKAAEVAGISQPSVTKFLAAVEALIDDACSNAMPAACVRRRHVARCFLS
ncbi:LysR family transcriptional regulator [Variovorax sp. E3]|uniref:LysR family transcriptional regulator n=1 Tax=Variovorax sp. E3 TaxID=1914993 RepID=UPI0018DCB1E7|nr:LysR family transcriptional regulator [Variovorax sp. E3]